MQNSFGNIGSIGSIQGLEGPKGTSAITGIGGSAVAAPTEEQTRSFGSTLAEAIGTVNESMDGAIKATDALMNGKAESIHEVQIAGAKSEVMMKLTTTITSKLAQATTQLFQMQV